MVLLFSLTQSLRVLSVVSHPLKYRLEYEDTFKTSRQKCSWLLELADPGLRLSGCSVMLRPVWSDLRTTHLLLAVRHRPDEAVEPAMARWAKVKIGPHSVDNTGVGLRKLLQMRLPCQSPGHILSKKGNQFSFLLIRLCRCVCVVCHHDSQRESTRTMKGHMITAGGRNAG